MGFDIEKKWSRWCRADATMIRATQIPRCLRFLKRNRSNKVEKE